MVDLKGFGTARISASEESPKAEEYPNIYNSKYAKYQRV